jgi:hypothetical protein
MRPKFRNLLEHIKIDIHGTAQTDSFIDKYIDHRGHWVNTQFKPGSMSSIRGYKIKASGEDPGCGVYFVPVDNPSAAVMVTDIAENNPSKIIGIAPDTGFSQNRIEIRTQYAGSKNRYLKNIRIITSSFVLDAAA